MHVSVDGDDYTADAARALAAELLEAAGALDRITGRGGRHGREALDALDDRQRQQVLGWLAYAVPWHVLDA